ncbi:hypothetical protein Ddye_020272 [Dipteronia dyeriana]|uniref:Uncharacterized protein n=1 Tax=Dipteronia dyeriana TaxID=168575 RepID=A0AAD9WWJ5_9ROSI|nr:hypothetical protein Ddye_020272 [Dipteronia dyeriana]
MYPLLFVVRAMSEEENWKSCQHLCSVTIPVRQRCRFCFLKARLKPPPFHDGILHFRDESEAKSHDFKTCMLSAATNEDDDVGSEE